MLNSIHAKPSSSLCELKKNNPLGYFLLDNPNPAGYHAIMKYGTQAKLARAAEISIAQVHHYLKGRKNASAPIADRLAALTGTDIRIWLLGGSAEARKAALEDWKPVEETLPS